MRRLMVTLSVLAMIAALLPIAALMATAEEAGASPRIAAPAGKTAVRQTDALNVAGPAGSAANGPINVTLLAFAPDGSIVFREENVPGVSVSDGKYTGDVTLGCGFGEPGSGRCEINGSAPDAQIVGVALEVPDGARSNALRVDYTDPEILRYELISPTMVRVLFSEPVRVPADSLGQRIERPSDWAVDGERPTDVSDPMDTTACTYAEAAMTTGCTRLLTLSAGNAQTEDATPYSQYLPDTVARLSAAYEDYANNSLAIAPAENSDALDRIRPAAPNIQAVAGKSPSGGQVAATDATPTVSLNGLTGGHVISLTFHPTGGGATTLEDRTVPAGDTAMTIDLHDLGDDAAYEISVLAIDGSGNRSDDAAKGAARADGASRMTYVLDTTAPLPLVASLVNRRTVDVAFTETILPGGNAGSWYVGDVPVEAEGTGERRRLVAAVDLTNPGPVRWEPTSQDAQPGSLGRYGDRAGNGLAAIANLALADLPAIPAPTVTTPTGTNYTNTSTATIAGTGPNAANLVADLFERGAEERLASTSVTNGAWSYSQTLAADKRYRYQVRLRDTQTGAISRRVPVADIVRDTSAPSVEVLAPVAMVGSAGDYAEGDGIAIQWRASDPAAGDNVRPDHGRNASIVAVYENGTRRTLAAFVEHQPSQEQTYTYTVTGSDINDHTTVKFEVAVTDLAKNVGTDVSGVVDLLKPAVGYTAVRTARETIEARFPVLLAPTSAPSNWLVDGVPALGRRSDRDDVTVITLAVPDPNLYLDANLKPDVQYQPSAPLDVNRLRSAEGDRPVTTGARKAVDRIRPEFSVTAPATPRVIDARSVHFEGTTDETSSPNTISAYPADATGARTGAAIATVKAGTDGAWALAVPLTPNRRNRIVLRASDPSSNRSDTLPSSPYTVIEDSKAPALRGLSPASGTVVGRRTRIRWTSVEAHRQFARLEYKLRSSSTWETIARTQDDGVYNWDTPKALNEKIFSLRVASVDQTGKRDALTRSGLRADLTRPLLDRARSVSPRKVRVFFSEAVRGTRARAFEVDGRSVRRVDGRGDVRTLILRRHMTRTNPVVEYSGSGTTDSLGNALRATDERAMRGFAFPVTDFEATRVSGRTVRLTWDDTRNRPAHVRGYRIYRDGKPIALVSWSSRSLRTRASGAHTYAIRTLDDQGRLSLARKDRIR